MRSAEEVAREIRRLTWDVLGNDGLVEEDGPALADLIRARDAEVRADERKGLIDSDGDDTLRLMHTEALSPWMRSGMLRAATLIADEAINEGWCGDGDD